MIHEKPGHKLEKKILRKLRKMKTFIFENFQKNKSFRFSQFSRNFVLRNLNFMEQSVSWHVSLLIPENRTQKYPKLTSLQHSEVDIRKFPGMSTSKYCGEVSFGYFWVRFLGIDRETCQEAHCAVKWKFFSRFLTRFLRLRHKYLHTL